MRKRSRMAGFSIIALCMLFAAGAAMAAITVPEKLKEIPLFSGASIKQATEMDKNSMVMMEIPAKAEDVFEFYKKELPGKGWKIFSQMQQEDDALLQCQKGTAMLQVAIHNEDEGKIACTLVLSEQ